MEEAVAEIAPSPDEESIRRWNEARDARIAWIHERSRLSRLVSHFFPVGTELTHWRGRVAYDDAVVVKAGPVYITVAFTLRDGRTRQQKLSAAELFERSGAELGLVTPKGYMRLGPKPA